MVGGKDGGGNGMIEALIGSEMLKKLQTASEVNGEKAGDSKSAKGEEDK